MRRSDFVIPFIPYIGAEFDCECDYFGFRLASIILHVMNTAGEPSNIQTEQLIC